MTCDVIPCVRAPSHDHSQDTSTPGVLPIDWQVGRSLDPAVLRVVSYMLVPITGSAAKALGGSSNPEPPPLRRPATPGQQHIYIYIHTHTIFGYSGLYTVTHLAVCLRQGA